MYVLIISHVCRLVGKGLHEMWSTSCLTIQPCGQCWLKVGSFYPIGFVFLGAVRMPQLRATDLADWREQARRWHRRRPGRDPLGIELAVRRLDLKARCAFYIAALDRGIQAEIPGSEACCVCGHPTHSWCEGCYARVLREPSCSFSAVCQTCDAAQWVCDLCVRAEVSHAKGRAAYNSTKEVLEIPTETAATAETVEITGWRDSAGVFTGQPAASIPIAEIASATGLTIEEVRSQLTFNSGRSVWPSAGTCPPSFGLWQAGAVCSTVGFYWNRNLYGPSSGVGFRPEVSRWVRSCPWSTGGGRGL